ncbi:MAG: DNA-processing protein DprA [Firmicutes bacterium]|nr:DNA-processing protein DprA [Bacillota bacterium]
MIHDEEEIKEFKKQGIHVIRRGDKNYPSRLNELRQPPPVLYCKGELSLLERPSIAIVGTRTCTRYGVEVAKRFSKKFAEAGAVVISGLADGIDTAAHQGACEVGAENTIAVLGNGVNYFYPSTNRDLQNKIGEKGLLISEYLPNEKSSKFFFPARNRIVAALASALLIVEADLKSGTMITKDFALELGIDVFAVPGNVTSLQSRGTNAIIKEAHVAIACEPDDVLSVFGITSPKGKTPKVKLPPVQLSFDEKRVLDIIGKEEIHIDDLIEQTGMEFGQFSSLLTNMEMRGLVQKYPGNIFTRKNR